MKPLLHLQFAVRQDSRRLFKLRFLLLPLLILFSLRSTVAAQSADLALTGARIRSI